MEVDSPAAVGLMASMVVLRPILEVVEGKA